MRTLVAVLALFTTVSGCSAEKADAAPERGLEVTASGFGFRLTLPDKEWSAGWKPADPNDRSCGGAEIPLLLLKPSIGTKISFFPAGTDKSPEQMALGILRQQPIAGERLRLYSAPTPDRAEMVMTSVDGADLSTIKMVVVRRIADDPALVLMIIGVSPWRNERAMFDGLDEIVAATRPLSPPK